MKPTITLLIPYAATLLVLSRIFDISPTILNIALLPPIFLASLCAGKRTASILPLDFFSALLVFLLVFSAIFTESGGIVYAVTRAGTFITYLWILYVSVRELSNGRTSIRDILAACFHSCIIILAASNLFFPPDIISYIVSQERYAGTLGPNMHGFISAFAVATFFALKKAPPGITAQGTRFVSLAVVSYLVVNLLLSGSRASLISLTLFFIFFLTAKGRPAARVAIVSAMTVLATAAYVFIFKNVSNLENAVLYLRLSEYSLNGRMQPIEFGIDKIIETGGMPLGLGNFRLLIEEFTRSGSFQPLDNVYLSCIIEFGLPFLSIFLFIIAYPFFSLVITSRPSEINNDSHLIVFSLLLMLYVEGLFENIFFSGLSLFSVIHIVLLSFAFYARYNRPTPNSSNNSLLSEEQLYPQRMVQNDG